MADLKKAFLQAQENVKTLTKKPGMDDFAFLYSHFKQAEKGDVSGARPGMLDLMGRGKYDSWAKLKGMSSEAAMKAYIEKVDSLLKTHK